MTVREFVHGSRRGVKVDMGLGGIGPLRKVASKEAGMHSASRAPDSKSMAGVGGDISPFP